MSKQGDLKVSLDTMQAEEQLDGLAEQIRGLGESIQDVEKKGAGDDSLDGRNIAERPDCDYTNHGGGG